MDRRGFLQMAAMMAAVSHMKIAAAAEPPDITDTHFEPTLLMQWTVLSTTLAVRAWANSKSRAELLSSPRKMIAGVWGGYPGGIRFTVHENTSSIFHFPLPIVDSRAKGWSEDQLLSQLDREIGDDDTFNVFLPVPVIFAAWTNKEFRRQLLKDPNAALSAMKYDLKGRKIIIHANTQNHYHLALPYSPNAYGEIAEMRAKFSSEYEGIMMGGGSTKCCASGTCDICL